MYEIAYLKYMFKNQIMQICKQLRVIPGTGFEIGENIAPAKFPKVHGEEVDNSTNINWNFFMSEEVAQFLQSESACSVNQERP